MSKAQSIFEALRTESKAGEKKKVTKIKLDESEGIVCPECGHKDSPENFIPTDGIYTCPVCGHKFEIEEAEVVTEKVKKVYRKKVVEEVPPVEEDPDLVECPECGLEAISDVYEVTEEGDLKCPNCGTVLELVVVEEEDEDPEEPEEDEVEEEEVENMSCASCGYEGPIDSFILLDDGTYECPECGAILELVDAEDAEDLEAVAETLAGKKRVEKLGRLVEDLKLPKSLKEDFGNGKYNKVKKYIGRKYSIEI